MGVAEPTGTARRGVVAFDVDGVLLQGLFLSRVASTTSVWIWIRSMWLGFLLKVGVLDIRQVVERAYAFQSGVPLKQLLSVGDSLHLVHGARELCAKLKEVGYHVVLVSAGVPQQVVERIASDLGADGAYGVLLEEADGVLTGRLLGDRHSDAREAAGPREDAPRTGLRLVGRHGRRRRRQQLGTSSRPPGGASASTRSGASCGRRDFVVYTRGTCYEILEFFPEGYKVGVTLRQTAIRHEVVPEGHTLCARSSSRSWRRGGRRRRSGSWES